MRKIRVVCCVLLVAAFGLVRPAEAKNYFQRVGEDFADIFQLNAGVGWGLAANVKATDLVTGYAGYAQTQRWGLGKRHIESWTEEEGGVPVIWGQRDTTALPSTDRRLSSRVVLVVDADDAHGESQRRNYGVERFNLELGATAGVVSLRVGFSLGQFADFLCTAVGFDLARDNAEPPPVKKKTTAKKKKKQKKSPAVKKDKKTKKKSSSKKDTSKKKSSKKSGTAKE